MTKEENTHIPDANTWAIIRETYKKIKQSSWDAADVALFEKISKQSTGFLVDIEVKYSTGKGRGVFVCHHCPKGTRLIQDWSGHFPTETLWRQFLKALPTTELARDAVVWSYVCDYEEHGSCVYLDLFEGSLVNHGYEKNNRTVNGDAAANMEYDEDEHGTYFMRASRDIQAGEELLCDYTKFHDYEHNLQWYNDTWKEYVGTENAHDL